MPRPSHLRLVVNNAQPGSGNRVEEYARENTELVLHLLEQLSTANLAGTWQSCLNYPQTKPENQYNKFMSRNWPYFSDLLNHQSENMEHKHRLVNYFMMQVYLVVMECKAQPEAELALTKLPYQPTRLDFWAKRYALKVINGEKSQNKTSFDVGQSGFGRRIRSIIESK